MAIMQNLNGGRETGGGRHENTVISTGNSHCYIPFTIETLRVSIADSCTFHRLLTCCNTADRGPIIGRGLHSR